MKRSMKRGKSILGIILAVIMMMGVIPMEGLQFVVDVYAEETAPTSGTFRKKLTWKLSDDGTLTISGTGKMEDWEYTIDVPWYSVSEKIYKVIISEEVTSIGGAAFSGCINLTEITIPGSVTTIGEHAFLGCSSLREITIPDGVTAIGTAAFSGCSSLTEITIPDGVTAIEMWSYVKI